MARDERPRPTRTGSGSLETTSSSSLPGTPHAFSTAVLRRESAHCAFAAALLSLLFLTQQVGPPTSVVLMVEGVPHRTVTAQRTIAGVLAEVGIPIEDSLRVQPSLDSPITPDLRIVVQRVRPLRLVLPDREVLYRGAGLTPARAFAALGLALGPRDILRIHSAVVSHDADLTHLRAVSPVAGTALVASSPLRIEGMRAARNPLHFDALEPVTVTLERALPLVVHERGQVVELAARGETLREALNDAEIPILPADLVRPDLDTPLRAGQHVYIERAKSIVLTVDRSLRVFRSRAERVEQVLQEQGIVLSSLDRVEPAPSTPMRDGLEIQVVRVREEQVIEEEELPFGTERVPTKELGLGEKQVVQAGSPGLRRHFYRVRVEDGEEVSRHLLGSEMPIEPVTHIVEFGTSAATVTTPQGELEYTRKLRVWATWYNASHGGKAPGHPAYGLTALGMRATYGVMAVDPTVIPLRTRAFVPGYGIAIAGDTGGGIKRNMIDLAFDEGAAVHWASRYTDIYLLGSPSLQDALRAAFPDE